jgi:hypothetical protein
MATNGSVLGQQAITLPIGNDTTERPASPTAGMIRYNSTASTAEGYNGEQWKPLGGGNPSLNIQMSNYFGGF